MVLDVAKQFTRPAGKIQQTDMPRIVRRQYIQHDGKTSLAIGLIGPIRPQRSVAKSLEARVIVAQNLNIAVIRAERLLHGEELL
jgi:hypothetical protein